MSVYLHDIPLSDAISRLQQALNDAELDGVLGVKEIPLDEHALGRVLSALPRLGHGWLCCASA